MGTLAHLTMKVCGCLRKPTIHITKIEELHIAKAQLTHLIDNLVDLNMGERKTDVSDRRTIDITLTALGRAFLEEHQSKTTHISEFRYGD